MFFVLFGKKVLLNQQLICHMNVHQFVAFVAE